MKLPHYPAQSGLASSPSEPEAYLSDMRESEGFGVVVNLAKQSLRIDA